MYDEDALDESIDRFIVAFSKEIPSFKAYEGAILRMARHG